MTGYPVKSKLFFNPFAASCLNARNDEAIMHFAFTLLIFSAAFSAKIRELLCTHVT